MSRHTGAFVYTGSGKKHSEDAPIEQKLCKREACAIQWCLARRNQGGVLQGFYRRVEGVLRPREG